MKNRLIKRIGAGIVGATALISGTRALANPSVQDLRALEDYAKQHGQAYNYTENGINKGPLYVLKQGDYTLEVNKDFMTLIKDGSMTYILHDAGKDGLAEAVISAEGRILGPQKAMLEMSARMGTDSDSLDADIQTADLFKRMDKKGEQKAYNERIETYLSKNGDVIFGNFKDEESCVLTGDKAASVRESVGNFYEKFVNAFKKTLGLNQ